MNRRVPMINRGLRVEPLQLAEEAQLRGHRPAQRVAAHVELLQLAEEAQLCGHRPAQLVPVNVRAAVENSVASSALPLASLN